MLFRSHICFPVTISDATMDWRVIWDQLIPEADDFINIQLQSRYGVPLRKTCKPVAGVATEYQKRIQDLAALYIAWRIESRTYSGAQNPGSSEYGDDLETQLNSFVNELTTDKIRLRGQRLKGPYRTVNPRFVPMVPDSETRSSNDASSGISEFNARK